MIQRALNTQAFTGQGEIEMMLYIHQEAAADDWSFDGAVKRAKETHPTGAPYMDVLAEYVQHNAGKNDDSEFLSDLNNFLKAFACDEKGALRTLEGGVHWEVEHPLMGQGHQVPAHQECMIDGQLGLDEGVRWHL